MFHLEKENLTIIFGITIEKRRSIKDERIKKNVDDFSFA